MALDAPTRERIDSLVASNDVMLFMKGNHDAPQCGFSATVIRILDTLIPDYATVDVLSDPALREGIKEYSEWPTIPQLYVKGEFIGGCDIIQELFESGELRKQLGIEIGAVAPPELTITAAAAEGLRGATADAGPDQVLHLVVNARYQSSLFLGPVSDNSIEVVANGVAFRMDPLTASRANGITIDAVDTPQGRGFRIDNPNAPQVHTMSVAQLRDRLASGEPFEFMDVRTSDERQKACIEGSKQMTEEEARRLEALPRDTPIVFI